MLTLSDDPLVPLGVTPWAVETFFTTLLCVIEIWKWDDRSQANKLGLTGCYGPYLVICEYSIPSLLFLCILWKLIKYDSPCVVCGHVSEGEGSFIVAKTAIAGQSQGGMKRKFQKSPVCSALMSS